MPESGTAGIIFLVFLSWVVVESGCFWWLDFSFDSMLGWDEWSSWWFFVLGVSELLLWSSLFFSELECLSGLDLLSVFCLSGFPLPGSLLSSDSFLPSDSFLSSDFLLKMPRSRSVRFSVCSEKALCFRISNSRSRSPKWLSSGSSGGFGGSEGSGLVELFELLGLFGLLGLLGLLESFVLLESPELLGLSESSESSVLSGLLSLIGCFALRFYRS